MDFWSGVLQYKWVILFYLLVIFFIIINRKRFEFQAKFIALYKTKVGLKLMDDIGVKHSNLVKRLGYAGIFFGYLGMLLITLVLVQGVYQLIFVPNAPPVVAPVLPGVPIPGSPVHLPLVHGLIALFFIIVIHEFSHGVVARAHNIHVKSSGILFLGPIVGAFVEPDENELSKQPSKVRNSVYAAGPFSNMLLALLVVLITLFVFAPIVQSYTKPIGVQFTNIEEGLPAAAAGLQVNTTYTFINNHTIKTTYDLEKIFDTLSVNDTITIGNDQQSYTVTTTSRASDPGRAIIGVNLRTKFSNEGTFLFSVILWVKELLDWILILSLGLGLANLLPLGPVDGGRMMLEASVKVFGEKKGKVIWSKLTMIIFVVLLFLVFVPIGRAMLESVRLFLFP